MIRSINLGSYKFLQMPSLNAFAANFHGSMIASIDLNSSGRMKQIAKVVAIISIAALAAMFLYWAAQRYYFKANSSNFFLLDLPKKVRQQKPGNLPFVQKSGFNLPSRGSSGP